jgi:carbohydrate kinase (thermoresistant glucokinase family)
MLYLVMGVTGSGKSTIGRALAERLLLPFYDADAFHPPVNRAKLAHNEPLDDGDRWPWLERIAAHVPRWEARGGAVLACSALKHEYRRVLLSNLEQGSTRRSRVVFLDVDRAAVLARLDARKGRHTLVREFDRIVTGQYRDLEPPRDAIVVSGLLPPHEIVERVLRSLSSEGSVSPRRLRIARGAPDAVIGHDETAAMVDDLLEGLGTLGRVLLVPPDHTRIHSAAGELTVALYERLRARGSFVEILPATGTHLPMTHDDLRRMFPGVPASSFSEHDFQNRVTTLGDVPAAFVDDVSGSRVDYPIRCEVASRLTDGSWDRILSIGQLVPHEVVGIANHNKNIFVGTGGKDVIDKTHFLGAVCNMERIMGSSQSPVREVLNYMAAELGRALPPVTYLLTVRQRIESAEGHATVTRGLYAGDDEGCFFAGSGLARQVNINLLDRPLRKVVVHLDPGEFRSTWLGNKAIYRTRMALGDGAELLVLAPGVDKFGEDPAIDRLIRRHGYSGTPHVLESVQRDPMLAKSLAAAAHLIHGSSEGRFQITYALDGGLSRDDVVSVGYGFEDYRTAVRRYDPTRLREGQNRLPDGEEIFYVSNPAVGLWAVRPTFSA